MSKNYSSRAAKIRTKKVQEAIDRRQKEYDQLPAKDKYWKEFVHTREDVVDFYHKYYPEFPEQMCQAMGLWMSDIVAGKIEPPPDFIRAMNKPDPDKLSWDYHAEIDKEKSLGLIGKFEQDTKKAEK